MYLCEKLMSSTLMKLREGAQKIKVPNAKIQLNSKGTDHRALRGFTNSPISASTAGIQ